MRVAVDTDRKLLEKATVVVVASQHTMVGGGAGGTHQAQASMTTCLSWTMMRCMTMMLGHRSPAESA